MGKGRECIPKIPSHTLTWSAERGDYELRPADPHLSYVAPGEEASWVAWVTTHASFSFQGQAGHLNVLKEMRPRGGAYWYAYHTNGGRTRKRYLGRAERVTLACLETTAQFLSSESPLPTAAPSSTRREVESPLPLSTKLASPRPPRALVERERLLSALDAALSTRLTLISASAGWGKTTLLSVWASRHQAQVTWLSLDELDNSLTRFWGSLIAALRGSVQYGSRLGETAVALLQSPLSPPLSAYLSALLQDLENAEAQTTPLVLVLDDYHLIEEPAIHEGIAFFLEHLPAHLHLVLSTRVDPVLPLARLRVLGQLTEIRMDELRFSSEEATDFLSQKLSPPLSEVEVRQLSLRTEGWIAGLQLAALAFQKRADRAVVLQAFTGSQRYLLDYVQEDILARLPTGVRDFLLQTAVLSRLDASVCQAVTAEPESQVSQQMLEWLERANLFLVPLDEERHSYRLHDLFREALLATLHTTHPDLEPILHRRVARYYEAQEQWTEAIAHRLDAADFSAAARLMEQTVEQFWLRGEVATVAHWVLRLPDGLVRTHACLVLTTALYLFHTATQTIREQRARAYQKVRQLMARVEAALRQEGDETRHQPQPLATQPAAGDAEEALLHRRLRWLRLYLALSEAIASGNFELWNRMQPEIEAALNQEEEALWQMAPLGWSFILYYTIRQEGAVLVPKLLEAKAQVSRSGSLFAALKVRQYLAIAALEAGQLQLAAEESQAALALIEQITGYALLKGYFEITLVEVWYQWNRIEEARALLHTVLHTAATAQQLDLLAWGYSMLMRVALATGDGSLAELSVHEMEALMQRERYGVLPNWLPALRAEWWLAQGQLKEASDWAAMVVFSEGAWSLDSYAAFPVVTRVYFAQQRWGEALELLERWSVRLDRASNRTITISFLAQLLVALHQTGKSEQAYKIAERLLALTEQEGYLRLYLDEGEPMREALLAWLTVSSRQPTPTPYTTAYVARILAAFEQETHGAHSAGKAATKPKSASSRTLKPALATSSQEVSLTAREQEVLLLLATGASNQEISQALVISLETVKKHVSNLLGKLGATSRTQAIALAQARSLL